MPQAPHPPGSSPGRPPDRRPAAFYDLLKYGSLGLEMGAAVVIGLLLGVWLDRRLQSSPWLTLLFLGFGFAAAVRAMLRAVRSGMALEDEEKGKKE